MAKPNYSLVLYFNVTWAIIYLTSVIVMPLLCYILATFFIYYDDF